MIRKTDLTKRIQVFKPGQSGNPAGRPKGARSKLCEDFLRDFHDDWKEHGKEAIAAAREKDPVAYMNIAAKILPKEIELDVGVGLAALLAGTEGARETAAVEDTGTSAVCH